MDKLGWKQFEMATLVTKYKTYPAYRPSGVEWLGKVPAHWNVTRLRATVLGWQNGVWGTEPKGSNDIACVRVADFDRVKFRANMSRPTVRSIEPDVIQTRMLYPGDLLLEVSGGGEKQPVGAVVIFDNEQPAVCSNFIAQLRPSEGFESRYLTYLHSALYSTRVNVRSIKQSIGIQNLDKASYLNEPAGFPPFPEQRAIAGFLDRETAKIDSLVAKMERLIELLQEKRIALISRAVTKGLDPNVPMKASGVEWLGEMPDHWEVKRLRATVLGCQNGVWGAEPNGSNDIACVRVADFDRVKFRANTSRPTLRSIEADVIRKRMLYPGDLLLEVSGGGEKQPVGTVVMYDDKQPAVCSNFIAQLRPSEGFESRYLTYLHSTLYSARVNVRSVKQSIGIQNLHKASYLNEAAGFPPLPEQQAIAGFLDRETTKIDALISKVREAIDRLTELRTALISAAVTGRIDVREEVE